MAVKSKGKRVKINSSLRKYKNLKLEVIIRIEIIFYKKKFYQIILWFLKRQRWQQ